MTGLPDSLGVVLIVPFWSKPNDLNTDSNYVYLRQVLPEMSRQSPGTLFCVLFPDPRKGAGKWGYTPDGLESDRIKFVRWPYDTAVQKGSCHYDIHRFREIEYNTGANIYWVQSVEMGAQLAGGYTANWSFVNRPAMVVHHRFIMHPTIVGGDNLHQQSRLLSQMAGTIAADAGVWNSAYTRKMAHESFGTYLNPTAWREIDDKSKVILFGLVDGREPEPAPAKPDDKPLVIYNHRTGGYKRPEITGRVFADLKARGIDFDVWLMQPSDQRTDHFPIDRAIFSRNRPEYLRNMAVPAINTTNTAYETFCIAILDSMIVGHVIVAPRACTFPELLPEGYPYLFDTVPQQTKMLAHIMDTWPDEYNRWSPVLREHARKNFAVEPYANEYLEFLWAAEEKHRREPKDTTVLKRENVYRSLPKNEPTPVVKITRAIQRMGLGTQSYTHIRCVRDASAYPWLRLVWKNGVNLVRTQ